MPQPLEQLVQDVASLLSQFSVKFVLAESCTGGLVSASLARVPGISNHLCGSAVVYRLDTKMKWLDISESVLVYPGPVSEPVAVAMAEGVLARTPEANLSAAITGHLGPNSPIDLDGVIFVGIVERGKSCRVYRERLAIPGIGSGNFADQTGREQRQWAAVEFVLRQVATTLRTTFADR